MTNPATQFKKGQSGNPKGAPKKAWTWAGTLRRLAEEEQASGTDLKDLMGKSLIKEGLKGNIPAIKEFGDRIDGKPLQPTDITSLGEKLVTGVICLPVQDGGSLETKSGKTDRSSKEKRA